MAGAKKPLRGLSAWERSFESKVRGASNVQWLQATCIFGDGRKVFLLNIIQVHWNADGFSQCVHACNELLRLNKLGATVLHGVDARRLEERFPVTRFKLVVFQFPNVASRSPLHGRNPNHVLIRRFLRSARHMLASNGWVSKKILCRSEVTQAF